jgi:hypothetical protein
MQIDPVAERQRLTEFYLGKTDGELEELAEDFGNLTETAQQVLETELRSRHLSLPGRDPRQASTAEQASRDTRFASSADSDVFRSRADADSDGPIDGSGADLDEDVPHEFTWKTPLCECDSEGQAWEIHKALWKAGIDSWVEQPGRDRVNRLRVVVAADQLDQALKIAAQPIPQDIIDEYDKEVPEFVPPTCPKCHAEDPVLESPDPSNNWLCEACDARWSDPLPEPDSDTAPDPA